jgi:hypothetical protein
MTAPVAPSAFADLVEREGLVVEARVLRSGDAGVSLASELEDLTSRVAPGGELWRLLHRACRLVGCGTPEQWADLTAVALGPRWRPDAAADVAAELAMLRTERDDLREERDGLRRQVAESVGLPVAARAS